MAPANHPPVDDEHRSDRNAALVKALLGFFDRKLEKLIHGWNRAAVEAVAVRNYARAVYHIARRRAHPDSHPMIRPQTKTTARIGFALRAAVAVLGVWLPAVLRASEIVATDDFRDVAAAVAQYADEFGPQRVVLVLDIDNTLLAMNQPLGSDQWFEWQKYLLDHEPQSNELVAENFEGLLEVQGLLYNLGRMHPPQPNLPALVRRMQRLGVHTLVLTSRGPEYRVATERELTDNGYDFESTAIPTPNLPGGEYLPYDLNGLEADGLEGHDVAAFGLKAPKPVTYDDGIYMTAGQPKGAMMIAMLHHAEPEIDAIVYADDHIRHVAYVFAAMAGRGKEIKAFHYTREEPRVKTFQYGDKEDVGRRWRRLSRTLDEVFQ